MSDIRAESPIPGDGLADPDSLESRLLELTGEAGHSGRLSWSQVAHILDIAEVQPHEDSTGAAGEAGATWRPVDVRALLAGDISPLEPTQLARSDGALLLYPGRVHDFHGPPESLKSWLAQVAAADVLRAGGRVLYLDFEAEARDVLGHLHLLGVSDEALVDRLDYVRPEEPFSEAARTTLLSRLARERPTLTILDGVNNAMAASGFEPNSNLEVRQWWERLVRPVQLCTDGPTVLVDHVTKDPEGRGQWAVGAGQKLAGIDGASFGFELLQPFGRGRTGVARILLHKDRPGRLRGQQSAGREVAVLRLVSSDDSVTCELLAPTDASTVTAGERWRPTSLMEGVSKVLEDAAAPLSKNAIEAAVDGRRDYVRKAIKALAEGGFISIIPGPRNSLLHRSDRPFRKDPPDLAPTSPDLAQPGAGRSEGDLARQGALPLGRPSRGEVDHSPHGEVMESLTSPNGTEDLAATFTDGDFPVDLADGTDLVEVDFSAVPLARPEVSTDQVGLLTAARKAGTK